MGKVERLDRFNQSIGISHKPSNIPAQFPPTLSIRTEKVSIMLIPLYGKLGGIVPKVITPGICLFAYVLPSGLISHLLLPSLILGSLYHTLYSIGVSPYLKVSGVAHRYKSFNIRAFLMFREEWER